MIRFSVFYPNTEGKKFDMDYYLNKHVPMVKEKLGDACKDVWVDEGINTGMNEDKAPYVAVFNLLCESVEVFQKALAPHAEEIFGDIPNYTDTEPLTQISKVKM